ncbi:MAG: hypothetical protein MUQ27_06400, partial [Acidimicrobiia bacterium]|nr:hypothetical protein [Acidimicrobiia bacterium]
WVHRRYAANRDAADDLFSAWLLAGRTAADHPGLDGGRAHSNTRPYRHIPADRLPHVLPDIDVSTVPPDVVDLVEDATRFR